MTEKAQAILEQAKQLDHEELQLVARCLNERLNADYEAEGIRIAMERKAQVERGEVEMLSRDEFQARVDGLLK
ncbi:MAG: hypothetical protein ACPG4K_09745 [Haloferula sp.]